MKTETSPCPAPIKEKLVSSKKSKQLKQLFAALSELNHEIYVCIKDKKSGNATQFASDLTQFSLDSFQKLIGASTEIKPIDKLQRHVQKLQQSPHSGNSLNQDFDSSSKKQTDTSSHGKKSDSGADPEVHLSNVELSDNEKGYSNTYPVDINQINHGFKIFDQKAYFESGNTKPMTNLLSPESLSYMDLHNEMSYQETKPSATALLSINQGFDNNEREEEASFMMEHPHVGFAKRFQEDDVGLRIDQNLRRANVFSYLTKSGAIIPDDDSDCMSYADYSYNSQSDCSESYLPNSHESSGLPQQEFDITKVEIDGAEDTPMIISKAKSAPLPFNEFSKEATLIEAAHSPKAEQPNTDMFFSCADWETQVNSTDQQEDVQGFIYPSTPKKRLNKCNLKFGTEPQIQRSSEFDVDCVMKKGANQSPSNEFKTAQVKRNFRHKKNGLRLSSFEEQCKKDTTPQPFMDLQLSPMGSPSFQCTPFEFSTTN